MRARVAVFVAIIQLILFLAHWFLYDTWTAFSAHPDTAGNDAMKVVAVLLSISFVSASLLAFRNSSWLTRVFYRLAAVWLGTLNFLFLAACACWAILLTALLTGQHLSRQPWAFLLFGLAILAAASGLLNARWIREKRVTLQLPGLPDAWRGRVAALVSDLHLGHVNGQAFLRHLVARLNHLKPDIVLVTGDLFDGTKVDANAAAAPWKNCSPPLGTYFVTGNHEEFSDSSPYLEAIRRSGMQVLTNEKVEVEGIQIAGVEHHVSTRADSFRRAMQGMGIDDQRPSILLSHSPHLLAIPEAVGVSLQLSGHTHGGQIPPFTWFTRRIFGAYTHGLNRFGNMLVYTSFGVGTWGPPMRLGTYPEIVLLEFA